MYPRSTITPTQRPKTKPENPFDRRQPFSHLMHRPGPRRSLPATNPKGGHAHAERNERCARPQRRAEPAHQRRGVAPAVPVLRDHRALHRAADCESRPAPPGERSVGLTGVGREGGRAYPLPSWKAVLMSPPASDLAFVGTADTITRMSTGMPGESSGRRTEGNREHVVRDRHPDDAQDRRREHHLPAL